jgi:polyphosphate kinase
MRIRREAQLFSEGKLARIALKLNSLVDEQIIDELYLAAKSGVPIDILVRGMCALKPGVPGLSESIRVHSVLGRYLEHSRIFYFENDGDPDVFIGSADMMHRNLDRRVETLVKLVQTDQIQDLKAIMDLGMSGNVATWVLGPDGLWSRRGVDADGVPLPDMQDELMKVVLNKKRVR